jgi:hypothetical protein
VLDDLDAGSPDIVPILRAFADPDRFLPEGEAGLPPSWVVVAGTREALERVDGAIGRSWRLAPFVELAPYPARTLATILEDRASRALGRPLTAAEAARLLDRAFEDGGGATRVVELLRRFCLGPEYASVFHAARARGELAVSVEPSVVRAIEDAAQGRGAVVGDVRRLEAHHARALGVAPLPATTLWRRIVRLERAGYVRREVRPGGPGGTRSVLRLIAPVDEWVVTPGPRGTRPGSGSWAGSTPGGPVPSEPGRPAPFPVTDDGAD